MQDDRRTRWELGQVEELAGLRSALLVDAGIVPPSERAGLASAVALVTARLLTGGGGVEALLESGGSRTPGTVVLRSRGGTALPQESLRRALGPAEPWLRAMVEEGDVLRVELAPREPGDSSPSRPPPLARSAEDPLQLLAEAEVAVLQALEGGHGGFSFAPIPLEVAALLEELRVIFAGRALEAGVTLDVRRPPMGLHARGDRGSVLHLLSELTGNAFRHSRRGGRVTVCALEADGEVVLKVRDTGRGIPAERVPQLFRWEWGPGEEGSQGAGARVGFARRLAEAQGGRLWLESQVGRGTTVSLAFPAG